MSQPKINVRVEKLIFKDESVYHGQVAPASNSSGSAVPYGYGCLSTKDGFLMEGTFIDGKTTGAGIFTAPNGDVFYGNWNANHKRDGKGCFIRAKDGQQLIEEYADGKLIKRVKRKAIPKGTLHWSWMSQCSPVEIKSMDKTTVRWGPSPRCAHTATLMMDGTLLVIFGGQSTSSSGLTTALNDVWIMDTETRTWIQPDTTGTPPPPGYGHTATAVGDQLIIIGGQNGMTVSSAVYVLNLRTGTWTCPIPKGIHFSNHTATLIGSHTIWVLIQNSVWTLDTHTWIWTEITDIDNRAFRFQTPKNVINQTAVGVGNMIYVIGGKLLGLQHQGDGKKYEKCTAELRIFHTTRRAWEVPDVTGPAPTTTSKSDYSGLKRGSWDTPRTEHTATLVGNQIYIIGGWTSMNPAMNLVDTSYLNDVQILDIETLRWRSVTTTHLFTPPRSLHTAVLVGDEIWVYGGRNDAHDEMSAWYVLHTMDDTEDDNNNDDDDKVESKESIESKKQLQAKIEAAAAAKQLAKTQVRPPSKPTSDFATPGTGSVLDLFKDQLNIK